MELAQDQAPRQGLPRGRMPYRQRCALTCLTSRFFGQPGRSRCSAIVAPIQKLYWDRWPEPGLSSDKRVSGRLQLTAGHPLERVKWCDKLTKGTGTF